jgi:hypothetical protein
VEPIEKTKTVGSTKRIEADRLSRHWLIASAIGALVGALAAMTLWTPLPAGARSLAPLVLPMLPPVAVAIGQAVTLYRLAPKLAMAIVWMIATLVLFIVAQAIAMFGFISASHLGPMETALYYSIGATPGAAVLGAVQREVLKAWQLRPTYWIIATIIGNIVGACLLIGIGSAIDAAGAGAVIACCKDQDRLTVTLAAPIVLIISMAQAFRFRNIVIDAES